MGGVLKISNFAAQKDKTKTKLKTNIIMKKIALICLFAAMTFGMAHAQDTEKTEVPAEFFTTRPSVEASTWGFSGALLS